MNNAEITTNKHVRGTITNYKTRAPITYHFSAFQTAADEIVITLCNICFHDNYSTMYFIPIKHNARGPFFRVNKKSISTSNAGPKTDAAEIIEHFCTHPAFCMDVIAELIFSGNVEKC